MKCLITYFRLTGHLLLLILAAVLWDNTLKIALAECPWTGRNSYQDLALLRTLEMGCLLILWKGQRMSIFGPKNTWPSHILWGLLISFMGWIGILTLHWLSLHFVKFDLLSQLRSPVMDTPLWSLLLAGSLCGPLLEELFFRAFLWDQLEGATATLGQRGWIALGMILSFAILHLQFDHSFVNQLPQFCIWITCASLSMTLMLCRKSILSAWVLHGFANAVILWPTTSPL